MKKILPVLFLLFVTFCVSAQLLEPKQHKGLYGFKSESKMVVATMDSRKV